jgi:hypothetical protein
MSLFIGIASLTLLSAVVALVLSHHWEERHGDNHY